MSDTGGSNRAYENEKPVGTGVDRTVNEKQIPITTCISSTSISRKNTTAHQNSIGGGDLECTWGTEASTKPASGTTEESSETNQTRSTSETWANHCMNGLSCSNRDCTLSHPRPRCRYRERCRRDDCYFWHPERQLSLELFDELIEPVSLHDTDDILQMSREFAAMSFFSGNISDFDELFYDNDMYSSHDYDPDENGIPFFVPHVHQYHHNDNGAVDQCSRLTAMEMNTLPTEIAKTDCSICLGGSTTKYKCTLPCAHAFHRGCVRTWLSEHDSCPECRTSVKNQLEEVKCGEYEPVALTWQDVLQIVGNRHARVSLRIHVSNTSSAPVNYSTFEPISLCATGWIEPDKPRLFRGLVYEDLVGVYYNWDNLTSYWFDGHVEIMKKHFKIILGRIMPERLFSLEFSDTIEYRIRIFDSEDAVTVNYENTEDDLWFRDMDTELLAVYKTPKGLFRMSARSAGGDDQIEPNVAYI
eukprot:CFRG6875T1